MNTERRERISERNAELAINLLAEQVGNIEAAIYIFDKELFAVQHQQLHFMLFQQIARMCISWLVLTAAKVEELWREYGVLAAPETKERMRLALKEISSRRLTDIRNKAVAHILDRQSGFPLSPEDIEEFFKTMFRGDPEGFIFWLRHPENPKAETLSRALRLFRADVLAAFPNVRITMPISTYSTPQGDVEH